MTATWKGEGAQHRGARPYQEDAWATRPLAGGGILAVVCDGMGGHAGGAVASRLAVDAFLGAPGDPASLSDRLAAANDAIRQRARGRLELSGMGTTLVGVTVLGDEMRWISVGDSMLYLAEGGELVRLNADHSMAPQIEALVAGGMLTREQADRHPSRHVLRAAVMGESLKLIDEGIRTLRVDARLLVCSDGVQTLPESDILPRVRRPVSGVVDAVLAQRRSHQDNVTALLIERES